MNKPFYGAATIPNANRVDIVSKYGIPGPGSYDSKNRNQQQIPKWSLKKRYEQGSCFEDISITPGPGKYQYDQGFKKSDEIIISTKGERDRTFFQKSYSHSLLNLPGAINPKSGVSFGYRQAIKEPQKSPGPIYHLDKIVEEKRIKKNQKNFNGFGSEKKKFISQKSNEPGPGSFDPINNSWKSKTCQNWVFGTSRRSQSVPATQLGPGQYNPKPWNKQGLKFKFRGKNHCKYEEVNNTGPGSYNIPDTKTKMGAKFSSPKNTNDINQNSDQYENNLSPCSYNPPRYLDKKEERGPSLGVKLEGKSMAPSQQPGPGNYQIAGSYRKGNGGYMGRKIQQKKKQISSTDNFYKYDPKINSVARDSPKFSFPQGRRSQKENMSATSQQFYHSNDKKSTGYSYSMGSSKRFAQMKKEIGLFKEHQMDYSTIGRLPNYMKKTSKK